MSRITEKIDGRSQAISGGGRVLHVALGLEMAQTAEETPRPGDSVISWGSMWGGTRSIDWCILLPMSQGQR